MATSLTQHIVAALKDGGALSSTEIADAVAEAAGRTVEASDIGGRLKKISDPGQCDLGRFVEREQKDGVYVYRLADEARDLSAEQLYGLTLRRGEARYSLEQALSDFPRLALHVADGEAPEKTEKEKKRRRPAETAEEGKKGDDATGFFVAGIGSSAGGLEALYEFLETLKPDSGLAYVLISHRSRDHDEDQFLDLMQKRSPVGAVLAEDGLKLSPDQVYVAPRNGVLGLKDGVFTVTPTDDAPEKTMPIDAFFKSMAAHLGDLAIGVVLSGMGSDGAAGLRDIKEAFGLCVAQDPDTAKYDSMPRNAMAHVGPDDVIPPGEIPEKLTAYAAHAAERLRLPPEDSDIPDVLPTIFSIVKSRTGHDFSGYKRSTCTRRVGRRMVVHGIESGRQYVQFLQRNPKEVDALVRELLILVTRFFRDRAAFEALKKQLRTRMEEKRRDDIPFRVWVAGCSTGEEAYSIAILLKEIMADLDRRFDVQLFATDLSKEAIERARDPRYPSGIAQDVGRERLERFFEEEDGAYRVKKEIREMMIFAPHDVIRDPPFTRLDLLSCRNLLIYLEGKLQKELLPTFHYALKENGLLFMGGSETVGSFTDLFEPVKSKMRIYRRKPGSHAHGGLIHTRTAVPGGAEPKNGAESDDIAVLHRRAILRHTAPASLVVDKEGEILSVYGKTSLFLELPEGASEINNLFKMAKNGLKPKVPAAVRRAAKSMETVRFAFARVRDNGDEHEVEGEAVPLTREDGMEGLVLVLLRDKGPPEESREKEEKGGQRRAKDAEKELERTRANLQTTVEELETSNEELKSTNEELQSTNEELQSSNEELESSKEEQQSLNEELVTVNSELQVKIDELSEANKHMRNLLDNLQIPVLFLDNDLKIQRFTAKLKELIKIIPSDVGRPIGDLTTHLADVDLSEIASEVLTTLAYKEREVKIRTDGGRWYQMRVLPYRTQDNVIDGVVILFMDIQEKKEALWASEETRRYAEAIVDTIREPLLVLDGKLNVLSANHSFYATFRLRDETVEGRSVYKIGDGAWDIPELRKLLGESIKDRHFFSDYAVEQDFPHIGHRRFLLNTRRLAGQSEEEEKILLAMEEEASE